jgi:hypothetical protein
MHSESNTCEISQKLVAAMPLRCSERSKVDDNYEEKEQDGNRRTQGMRL